MTNTVRLWVFGPLVFILIGFVAVHLLLRKLLPPIELPAYEQVQVKWLEQNWTPDDWQWFYHASQGGALSLPIPTGSPPSSVPWCRCSSANSLGC